MARSHASLSARPGEVITMVAGTFFAIPPGPTRAQSASANSGRADGVPSRPARGVRPPRGQRTRQCSSLHRRDAGATAARAARSPPASPMASDRERLAALCRYVRPAVATPVRVRCRVVVHGRRDAQQDRRWTSPRTTWARRNRARQRGRRWSFVLAERGCLASSAHSREMSWHGAAGVRPSVNQAINACEPILW